MYEGTIRMLMEYGATTLEHLELLQKGNKIFKTVNPISHFFISRLNYKKILDYYLIIKHFLI